MSLGQGAIGDLWVLGRVLNAQMASEATLFLTSLTSMPSTNDSRAGIVASLISTICQCTFLSVTFGLLGALSILRDSVSPTAVNPAFTAVSSLRGNSKSSRAVTF